jgi:hypothetical protein
MGRAASGPCQHKKGFPQAEIPFYFLSTQKKNPALAGFSFGS